MTPNYIKKIPFIIPEKSFLDLITEKTKKILQSIKYSGIYDETMETEVWKVIEEIYQL